MEQKKPVDTGMYIYFIRYRKILTIGCIFLLVFGIPVQIYNAPIFDESHKYADIGFLLDTALIYLAVPVWMLIKIRKANKVYRDEEEWKKM